MFLFFPQKCISQSEYHNKGSTIDLQTTVRGPMGPAALSTSSQKVIVFSLAYLIPYALVFGVHWTPKEVEAWVIFYSSMKVNYLGVVGFCEQFFLLPPFILSVLVYYEFLIVDYFSAFRLGVQGKSQTKWLAISFYFRHWTLYTVP